MLHNNLHPDFVYLFITDLVRIPGGHDYKVYADKEPRYGECWLRAYITAFSSKKDGLMSEALLKAIHEEAMAFNPYATPGKYKQDYNKITLFPSKSRVNNRDCINTSYAVTSEGLEELFNDWMRHQSGSIHYGVAFETHTLQLPVKAYIYRTMSDYPDSIVRSKLDNNSEMVHHAISYDDAIKEMKILAEDYRYTCEINPMIDINDLNELAELTVTKMQEIIAEFNEKIVKAISPDEKIRLIAKYAKWIDQLHPFSDGNIRTLYILINKLLRDHDLSLTLMINPNRLDAFSTDEIVIMIKQGQIHYQQLLQHIEGNIVLKSEHEMISHTQSITCKPQCVYDIDKAVVEQFIDCVIRGNLENSYVVTNNINALFAGKSSQSTMKISNMILDQFHDSNLRMDMNAASNKDFIAAIKSEKFNLALRVACYQQKAVIIFTLLSFNSSIGFDPLEISLSTKRNAFDWMDMNKQLNVNDKETIKKYLLSCIEQNEMKKNCSYNVK